MGARIPTPYSAEINRQLGGISDTTYVGDVYRFMGCSLLNANMSVGFNSTASSLSVTIVEDKQNGDFFTEPTIPSIWAFSLPKGGVGEPVLPNTVLDLNPTHYTAANVPFYFCGVCTNWKRDEINISGKTISVSLVDAREILSGVQCLLGGFSLTQNIGTGTPRFNSVDNVIDVFGYFDYGMESEKNEYGIQWSKIMEVLNNVRVRVHGMYFEFEFDGECFLDAPAFYRIPDEVIDVMALVQKVANDGGSDLIVRARKISATEMLVKFVGIRRSNMNPLTRTEINNFIVARRSIVENYSLGQEYRNEPTSSIIIGGAKNSNYVAWPTEYVPLMHLNDAEDKDYILRFPPDIKARLFGGQGWVYEEQPNGTVEKQYRNYSHNVGAIFPFWGHMSDDEAYPMAEPFLPLDHLCFDRQSVAFGNLKRRIPYCQLAVRMFKVRTVEHSSVFLSYDGDSDERPFGYISNYVVNQEVSPGPDWVQGLPLNTEVLRAAARSYEAFWNIYKLYYPDIAEAMGICGPKWSDIKDRIQTAIAKGEDVEVLLKDLDIKGYMFDEAGLEADKEEIVKNVGDEAGITNKNDPAWDKIRARLTSVGIINRQFRSMIHEMVRDYASEHMGKKFIVCLPKSLIMERIWLGLDVPTRPEKPEIEYLVDNTGHWETVPAEFDGVGSTTKRLNIVGVTSTVPSDAEEQIRRKFMAEDGRFYPMAVLNYKPRGNANFNSNGINKAMFDSFSSQDYRPNKIAQDFIERVFVACSPVQLEKRPDLAIVDIPTACDFDPTDYTTTDGLDTIDPTLDDERLASKSGVLRYLWNMYNSDNKCREMFKIAADHLGQNFRILAGKIIKHWANSLSYQDSLPFQRSYASEKIMDYEAFIIPLTSTWVSYGPWYATYDEANGMASVTIDESLVPWNFTTPYEVDPNGQPIEDGLTPAQRLVQAGLERLERTIADVECLDSAVITVAGFPEYGPGSNLGFNSNLTTITVDFGIGGIKTTYNFATYYAKPGTYRKSEYDDLSRVRIDTRIKRKDIENKNLVHGLPYFPNGTNRFRVATDPRA